MCLGRSTGAFPVDCDSCTDSAEDDAARLSVHLLALFAAVAKVDRSMPASKGLSVYHSKILSEYGSSLLVFLSLLGM